MGAVAEAELKAKMLILNGPTKATQVPRHIRKNYPNHFTNNQITYLEKKSKATPRSDLQVGEYVVYGHYNTAGDLFYIGSGSYKRAYAEEGRNRLWWSCVLLECKRGQHTTEILHEANTREEAFWKEEQLIRSLKPKANINGVTRNIHTRLSMPMEAN